MAINDFRTESPENYEQKCCCALVLDVPGSMEGAPIKELNEGLRQFYNDIVNDPVTANRLEVAIIEFSDTVKTLVTPKLVSNFEMPKLTTKGTTKLVDGVKEAISIVKLRKAWYNQTGQPYYRSWIILITDAAADSDQDVAGLSRDIKNGMDKKEFYFFAIGVEGADMEVLTKISDVKMPPSKLKGLRFSAFFKWLSNSMSTIAKDGEMIDLSKPDWREGFSV